MCHFQTCHGAIQENPLNKQFVLQQVKSALHQVTLELENWAHNIIYILKQSEKCSNDDTITKYKQDIGQMLIQELRKEYQRCEDVYDHWGLDVKDNFSTLQRIQFKHIVLTCAETAKMLTEDRITNIVWDCYNVAKPKKSFKGK